MHVELQIGHLVEGAIALVASKGLLSRVNHNVIAQIPLLVKSFPADVADESLLVAVCSEMSLKRGRPVKTLSTFVAFMRFFLCVNDLVPTQGAGQAKPLPTNVADKRSTLSVIGHF